MNEEIIRCKCCGSTDISIPRYSRIGKCKSCGASIILPDLENHEITSLLNQAILERNNYEFDKAISTCQYIISKASDELLAYEEIILSKYGIVFVDDSTSSAKVPTCHRYNPISIFKDADFQEYISLCRNEDERLVFYNLASEIDKLQKNIKKQLEKEKDYDVFISFKSKNKEGKSTEDALIARDLYDELTNAGFDVFMSDVSLKNRINEEYEPIIYNALHTSEVFILVGTSKENVYSPWVRNEWSRYFDIIKSNYGGEAIAKYLPVYKDMDPNEMPRLNNRLVQCVDASDLLYKKNVCAYIKNLLKPQSNKNFRNIKHEEIQAKKQKAKEEKEKLKEERIKKRQLENERRDKIRQEKLENKEFERKYKNYEKKKINKESLLFFLIIGSIAIICAILVPVCINSQENKTQEYYNSLLPTYTSIETGDFSIEVDTEYSFMPCDEYVYVARAVTSDAIKVERWAKNKFLSKAMGLDKELGIFKINDINLGFKWVDAEHTSFSFSFQDKEVSAIRTLRTVIFTINISSEDKCKGTNYLNDIACYQYKNDNDHYYRAIPLSDTFVKIECWDSSGLFGANFYAYDYRLINIQSNDTDFSWSADKTVFLLTCSDYLNKTNWKNDKLVSFELINTTFKYHTVLDYLSK